MRDFGFAFNDDVFADRVLHIEIISEGSVDSKSDYEFCHHNIRKRKLKNDDKETGDTAYSCDSSSVCSDSVGEVKVFHLSSPILAEKSNFFYKMFKNGMRESQERHFTLKINANEEVALMDLLKFIYNNTLCATTAPDLLDVLMIADKFEVISCMSYCSDLLAKLPMSLELALLYLDLPSNVLMAEAVQPIKDAAKRYLSAHYKDFANSKKEAMALPLSALEVVLGSDDLQVASEYKVWKFILKWARAHYPKLEERREILTKHLIQFICFPRLSCSTLREVLDCPDFDREQVSECVMKALFYKVEVPYGNHNYSPKDLATTNCSFSRRCYMHRPIKAVLFELPQPCCVVYFDLKKEECGTLFPSGELMCQPFCIGGKLFCLVVECIHKQQISSHQFGLFVEREKCTEIFTLDVEFAVRKKPSKEFRTLFKKKNCSLTPNIVALGCEDLFRTSWTNFMSDDNKYFIDGVLHLRVELIVSNSQDSTCL